MDGLLLVDLVGRKVKVPETEEKNAAMKWCSCWAEKIVIVKSGHTSSYILTNLTSLRLASMVHCLAEAYHPAQDLISKVKKRDFQKGSPSYNI